LFHIIDGSGRTAKTDGKGLEVEQKLEAGRPGSEAKKAWAHLSPE